MRVTRNDDPAPFAFAGGVDIAAMRAELERRAPEADDRRRRAGATTALLPLGVACGGRPRREAPRRQPAGL